MAADALSDCCERGDLAARIEAAAKVYETVAVNWLVSYRQDGAGVVLDGDEFTAEQLEAIALLMRHAPQRLVT
jgi:hypothetical protein